MGTLYWPGGSAAKLLWDQPTYNRCMSFTDHIKELSQVCDTAVFFNPRQAAVL